MSHWDRLGRTQRRLSALIVLVVVLGVVVALGIVHVRPPVASAPLVSAGIGCFLDLRVSPATATPTVTKVQAETSARQYAVSPGGQTLGQPGALLDARVVTVVASGLRQNDRDSLAGQDVWLLHFAFSPAHGSQDLPVTGGQSLRWQHYAIVDAQTRMAVESCSSPLPTIPGQ
jgi:hypothetical protein